MGMVYENGHAMGANSPNDISIYDTLYTKNITISNHTFTSNSDYQYFILDYSKTYFYKYNIIQIYFCINSATITKVSTGTVSLYIEYCASGTSSGTIDSTFNIANYGAYTSSTTLTNKITRLKIPYGNYAYPGLTTPSTGYYTYSDVPKILNLSNTVFPTPTSTSPAIGIFLVISNVSSPKYTLTLDATFKLIGYY